MIGKSKIFLLVLSVILLVVIPLFFTGYSNQTTDTKSLGTVDGVELNSSLAIQTMVQGVVLQGPPPSPYDIAFLVLNRSNENMVFADQSFELKVYKFDSLSNNWKQIKLQRPLVNPRQRILPSNLNSWNPRIDNIGSILKEDFLDFSFDKLRLYISGVGETSRKKYGAYVDIDIKTR